MKMQNSHKKSLPTAISIALMVLALLLSRVLLPSQDQESSGLGKQEVTSQSEITQEDQTVEAQANETQVAQGQETKPDETKVIQQETQADISQDSKAPEGRGIEASFRNKKLLDSHYEKHGKDMGFASAKEYEAAALSVVNNMEALHKTEAEDGDDIYYLEKTNEFVVVSKDGYIRTYFLPDSGKKYYDKQ